MKTLEQIKKDKNWLAYKKGYPQDPEGFSFECLFNRFYDELSELQKKIEAIPDKEGNLILIPESQFYCNDLIMDELADLSNIIDYIATKIVVYYSTKYPDRKQGD